MNLRTTTSPWMQHGGQILLRVLRTLVFLQIHALGLDSHLALAANSGESPLRYEWSEGDSPVNKATSKLDVENTFSLLIPPLEQSGPAKSSSWGDATGDGFIDLLVASASGGILYENQDAGTKFSSFPRSLLEDVGSSFVWGDFNNDGRLDLFGLGEIGTRNTNRFLLRNEGNGSFLPLPRAFPEGQAEPGIAAAWADYDGDGWIDLFVAGGGAPDCLYHNERDGTFTRATHSGVKFTANNSKACVWGDIDNDGSIDLIVMAHPRSLLYCNLGLGRFQLITNHGIASDSTTEACTLGDYDNDGYLDLFVCKGVTRNALHRNLGNRTFLELTIPSPLLEETDGRSASWGDYNNDGWQDLFITSERRLTNGLFRNENGQAFSRVRPGVMGDRVETSDATFADFDNDGALDVFVTETNYYRNLYRNQGNSNSWLEVLCSGRVSSRDGIGARVSVTAQIDGIEQRQIRTISGGEGRGGQNGLRAHFGLGNAERVLTLRVDWPSGLVTELHDLPVNRHQKVEEPLELHLSALGGGRVEATPQTNQYLSGVTVTLQAIPQTPFQSFVSWNDGVRSTSRQIVLSSTNHRYQAIFTNTEPREEKLLPQWQKSFGGSLDDHLTALEVTSDGGLLVAGSSRSRSGGNFTGIHFGVLEDYWALRLDADGETIWQAGWGGEAEDHLKSVRQTPDGGFLLAGDSNSERGGSKEAERFGGFDLWVVKVGADGTKLWERSYGGDGDERLGAMEITQDGGFVMAAASTSGISGQKSSANTGMTNLWVLKADRSGNLMWEQTLGGTGSDAPSALAVTYDGGILIGSTSSSPKSGSKLVPHFGGTDFWLVRLDAKGRLRWQQSFGGSADEILSQISPTAGGGFLVGGSSSSTPSGNKTTENLGGADGWILRLDDEGNKVLERAVGGDRADSVQSLLGLPDGGLAALCSTWSGIGPDKPDASYEREDFWVLREDGHGRRLWSKAYGGSGNDAPAVLKPIDGQSLAIAGSSDSPLGGNKTSPRFGGTDFWVMRVAWQEAALGAPSILVNGSFPRNALYSTPATNTATITLQTSLHGEPIYYTLDGTLPDFTSALADEVSAIQLESSAIVQAVVYSPIDGLPHYSEPVRVDFVELFSIADRIPGGGRIELDPPHGPYLKGSRVKLKARAFEGWSFMGWEGDVVATTEETMIQVDEPKTVLARFGTPLLSVLIPVENNSVQAYPELDLYAFGSKVRLTAKAGAGRCFHRWFSPSSGDASNPLTLDITTPSRRVNAYFVTLPPNTVTLTPLIHGQGTVASTPLTNCYPRGSQVLLSATADPGWVFTGWEGDLTSRLNPAELVLVTSKVVTARFDRILETNKPPLVSLEAPVEGSSFLQPGNVTLKARVLDPESELVSVEFLVGVERLITLQVPPFEFLWTNAPVGLHELRTVAVNRAGLATTSAPVRITIQPGGPELVLERSTYETDEPNRNLTIRVIKRGVGPATVSFSTVDQTATSASLPFRDYDRRSGALLFSSEETTKEVKITILDDFFVEPAESFILKLSDPGNGARLGERSEASVIILANDAGLDTNSLLQLIFPCPIEARSDLQVRLSGADGRGQWRFPWESDWRPAGQVVPGLQPGGWPIEFRGLSGFSEPFPELVTVTSSGSRTILQRQYQGPIDSTGKSSLMVELQPTEHSTEFGWRMSGETGWRFAGESVDLVPGRHVIEFFSASAGFTAPPNLVTETFLNGQSQVSVTFSTSPPPEPGALIAEMIGGLDDLEGGLDLPEIRKPYVYNGQLVSEAGFASAFAVTKQVLLTAAHAVFNDRTMSIASNVLWFPRRHGTNYYPTPLQPRGIILLTNYLEARREELSAGTSPGVAGTKSQALDVAALWFDTPVICEEAEGGCLVSVTGGTNYLQPRGNTLFIGYPIQGTASPGFLHSRVVDRLDATPLNAADERVWITPRFRSFPGNSGGPVCVPARPGPGEPLTYYPAGILLGDVAGKSRIRRIDTEVLELINYANSAAYQGSNFTSGGIINVALFGGTNSTRTVEVSVKLGPSAALQAGAGWRFETEAEASFRTTNSSPFVLRAGNFNIVFRQAEGFLTLSNYTLELVGMFGLKGVQIEANYAPRISLSLSASKQQLHLVAPTGISYRIESSTTLSDQPVWMPLFTNVDNNPRVFLSLPNGLTNPATFFRATYAPAND